MKEKSKSKMKSKIKNAVKNAVKKVVAKAKKLTQAQRSEQASQRLTAYNATAKAYRKVKGKKVAVLMVVKRKVNGFTKRVKLFSIASTTFLRGLGAHGFTVSQAKDVCDHFGLALNDFTIASHISKGANGVETHGKIPSVSNKDLAACKAIAAQAQARRDKTSKTTTKTEAIAA